MVMLFHRDSEKQRLVRELQFHLEQQTVENVDRGMAPEEARTAALRIFGNPTLLQDETRSTWSWDWLESVWRDVRYGMRTLRHAPSFSLTAILVMALGIGATTSLFTIVRSVLLQPLPFRDPDKLVMLYEHFRQDTVYVYNVVAPADFHDWREQTHGFKDMAAWVSYGGNVTGDHGDLPEVVQGAGGSWNLFSVLGVQPALGRTFTQDEDRQDSNVVILSWSFFQSRFGGDKNIIGKTLRLDTVPRTIVGVLPPWFSYPNPSVKVWLPYSSVFLPTYLESHDHHQSFVIARARDKASIAAATKEVSALQYRLHMQFQGKPVAEDVLSRPMIEDLVQDVKTPLVVLMGSVLCMLLIACLNVSNLLVARGSAKRKEVAIRGALGGSRWKLVREQITESFLICIAGGILGLALSYSATQWLATHWRGLPRTDAIHMDGTVLLFSLAIAFVAAMLSGLVPAISSTGKNLLVALQDSARSIGGSASKAALRKTLLAAEIALTVTLLISAGLLFKSFLNLRTSDLGCVTDNVLTMKYGLPDKQYDTGEKLNAFHQSLLERVRNLPGVRAAGLVSTAPGGGYEGDTIFTIPERPSTSGSILDQDAIVRKADPGYFSALAIPLLKGRFFTEQDSMGRTHNVIISKLFADKFFPNDNPLGKHIKVLWAGKNDPQEIIGVVGDTIHDIGQPLKATFYLPILAGVPLHTSAATLVVRTASDPLLLSQSVQKQFAALDPQLPVYDVMTMQQIIGKATASQNFSASLVLGFATLSLLLAAVGLYGVLSYLVTQRITEIGIRMALGAQRSEVLRLVLLDGMWPVLWGLVVGLGGGIATGLLIKSILYGTRALDPIVLVVMVFSLIFTALLASAVPALRACRIEPTQALKTE